jgi:hypothetical protein
MSDSSKDHMVHINKDWENIYETLCRGSDCIFDQMTSLFCLCATIGL